MIQPLWQHTADYTYLWWANGLRDPKAVFNLQTSRYGLSFDANRFQLLRLGWIDSAPPEGEVLREDNARIDGLPQAGLSAWVELDGKSYAVIQAGRTVDDHQLIESGRYFARRWQTFLAWEDGPAQYGFPQPFGVESGLEIAAWPDRLALILRLEPVKALEKAALGLTLTIPRGYTVETGKNGLELRDPASSTSFVLQAAQPGLGIQYDPQARTCSVRVGAGDWGAGQARTVGLIFQQAPPFSSDGAVGEEEPPLAVQAVQFAPAGAPPAGDTPTADTPSLHDLAVQYQPEYGWYTVSLRNDGVQTDGQTNKQLLDANHQRMERVKLRIPNPGTHTRTVRLNFQKEGEVFGIVGISAMLRDLDGNPLGIPLQISKNWHSGRAVNESKRFEGPWYRGLTMVAVGPGETLEFEYTSVNALWGGLPAASHAQLCLVGWGSNQLWEEAALGAWGENLCFEPDQGQAVGAVLDTRPLMVWAMGNVPQAKWGWTNNVGGADFLVYYDLEVEKQRHSRMKTLHQRGGPNLSEVTYAGVSHDRKIGLQYAVSLYRSDDITRGIYRFRYEVHEKLDFTRLILFQCGGDDYSYTSERKFAIGNAQGLLKEWQTQWGGGEYRTERIELNGDAPWISMHEAVSRDTNGNGAWANRGLVLRDWNAVLGGKKCRPWIAERGIFTQGTDSSLIDFLPPPDVKALLPGDYVEATIVHVVVPQYAGDYYGPNANLSDALRANQNTWKMIFREAAGNQVEVNVIRGGTLERSYPIQIRAEAQARGSLFDLGRRASPKQLVEVVFQVTGGLAYLPVTVRGLEDYRGWRMEREEGAQGGTPTWKVIDQSVYGHDFWQTDFDPLRGLWDLTYSLPCDTPQDQRTAVVYRLVRDNP